MQSQNRIAYISTFTAATIALFSIETLFPKPAPGIRLGLANIFILLVLLTYGYKEALLVGVLKSVIGSIILGRFLSPSFLLSISGTMVSISVMWVSIKYFKVLSLVGISILGAESHIITQILIVSSLFLGKTSIQYLLPPYILMALIAGSLTGFITYWLFTKFRRKLVIA
jgi:heptaprenyl diphosphate synthase